MNIFHYILLTFSILGVLSSIVEAIKEKNRIRTVATIMVSLIWCALIVLSAYY